MPETVGDVRRKTQASIIGRVFGATIYIKTRRHLRWGLRGILAGLVLFAALAGASEELVASTYPRYPRLFGTHEVRSSNVTRFRHWTGMLKRHFVERDLREGSCADVKLNRCHLREWQAFLEGLRQVDAMTQLDQVNRYMNRASYITDPRNYNVLDHWATPRQFLERGGDCEDYAIAKFMALRALGWANVDLRIVVVNDFNLRTRHAVLVAYRDGVAWVLDNRMRPIVASDRIKHYLPIFSLNEDSWWRHQR